MKALSSAAALAAVLACAACSESDLAYLMESGTYPDQTASDQYIECPTGAVTIKGGIRGGEAYNYAINGTQYRIGVNFGSRFGGGNQYYAEPGQRSDTLWRSPVDATGAGFSVQCRVD